MADQMLARATRARRARDPQDRQHELLMLHILGTARATSSGIKSGSRKRCVLIFCDSANGAFVGYWVTTLSLYGKPETNASHTAMVSINARLKLGQNKQQQQNSFWS